VTLSNLLLLVSSIFFGLNMGGSGFTPAFSAALGSRLITRLAAILLFTVCVGAGGLLLGGHVASTLGGEFVPAETIDRTTALVIIMSAALALFAANIVKVPESTSWVTVFALVALGLVRGNLNTHTLIHKLLPAWIAVPPLSFGITLLVGRLLYPLRGWNYRLFEHLSKHEWKMRLIVLGSSCYLAVAIGANNIANVVGPLSTAHVFDVTTGMIAFTPVFGLGAYFFGGSAKTIGVDVVPLGLYSAAIINVVVGTLVITVSWLGIPQSLVHAQVLSVFAISFLKHGSYEMLRHRLVRRIVMFWVVSPLLAATFVVILLKVL
jgi:sulfate permease